MTTLLHWRATASAVAATLVLTACGGGGGGDSSPATPTPGGTGVTPTQPTTPTTPTNPTPTDPAPSNPTPTNPTTPVTPDPVPTPPPTTSPDPSVGEAGAPVLTGNIAADGRAWINFRRTQIGMPISAENAQINDAAARHSEYLRLNNTISHDQIVGRPGFTGIKLDARLVQAGYTIPTNEAYALGEVISGAQNGSGFYMAEELITAIYHRFVIFEPMFKEIGTGGASAASGYNYFTADFASRNGFGPGIAVNTLVVWPFNGQTRVPTFFLSDTEQPDPIPDTGINAVGYPISVHANVNATISVTSFTVRARGGSTDLVTRTVNPLSSGKAAASIVPMMTLTPSTTYDVSFVGKVNNVAVTRNWSFTTGAVVQ